MLDWSTTIFIILILMLLITFATGWYLSSKIILPKTHSREFTLKHEVEQGKIELSGFLKFRCQEVRIPSPFGYELHGMYFPQDGARFAIAISHGITWSLFGSVKYMDMFYQRGYSVLLYDNRNHGDNPKTNTTFGYFEKYDLQVCLDWLVQQNPPGTKLGLMGESLGAGISLQCAAMDPRVSFVVADCPYSDLQKLLEYRARFDYHHIPVKPILALAEIFVFFRAHFRYRDVSPIRDLQGCSTPVFFGHGSEDKYIPPQMSIEMYQQSPSTRRLYISPGARHAEAYWTNRLDYELQVDQFLRELVE